MELANSPQNTSTGLLPDLKVNMCGYDFYLKVQVVEDATYETHLGLPFHILTHLASQFFKDEFPHITLMDTNTGAVVNMPTSERSKLSNVYMYYRVFRNRRAVQQTGRK